MHTYIAGIFYQPQDGEIFVTPRLLITDELLDVKMEFNRVNLNVLCGELLDCLVTHDPSDVRGITLPEEECLQLWPDLLIAPVFTEHVRGINLTRDVVERNHIGGDCLANPVE